MLRLLALWQVEPFQRSLTDLNVDVMINGRRRDHGFERAHLEVSLQGNPPFTVLASHA